MIRICHLADTLNMGGLENIIKDTVLNLDKAGYGSEVWCLKDKGVLADDIEAAGIAVRPFYFEGGLEIRYLLRLVKALKEKRFDIIHSYGLFPIVWGTIAAIFARVPARIATCGNCYGDIGPKNRLKLRFVSYFTTCFIAVCEAVRKPLVEFVGIPFSKIGIIYSSARRIDPKGLDEKKKIREKLGIKDTDFVIGSVGRLVGHKGHQYMIEALLMLEPSIPNIKYLIIGDGPAAETLRSKVKSLNLENAVLFAGLKRDTTDLLSIMDIFVQPSASREGLPMALAEAASAGLPLVATDIGGNREIVKNGINGFIVPPKDAARLAEKVRYLAENPDEKKKMGDNSRAIWQEKFTLKKMLDDLGVIYEKAAGHL